MIVGVVCRNLRFVLLAVVEHQVEVHRADVFGQFASNKRAAVCKSVVTEFQFDGHVGQVDYSNRSTVKGMCAKAYKAVGKFDFGNVGGGKCVVADFGDVARRRSDKSVLFARGRPGAVFFKGQCGKIAVVESVFADCKGSLVGRCAKHHFVEVA